VTTFNLRDLDIPVIGAPMAGGPSTPALAAAVSNAGGLGFLSGALLTPERLAAAIGEARSLTSAPLGVNLFVPQPDAGKNADIEAYVQELTPWAQQFGASLGEPRYDDDAWSQKLAVLHDLKPEAVSFTFGCATADEVHGLVNAGMFTLGTVTTGAEAHVALERGVNALVAQGPGAGGHRGTFDPTAEPATDTLDALLSGVTQLGVDVVATGGITTPAEVARVIGLGAQAVQVGTALLLSDEAGTNPVYRKALTDPQFVTTGVTRAFSGRYARGLYNHFMQAHDATAPCAYPQIHHLTGPVRAAAVKAGDPHSTNLWAGTDFRHATGGPAGAIVTKLAELL
jgi:nitronate monooxygenase